VTVVAGVSWYEPHLDSLIEIWIPQGSTPALIPRFLVPTDLDHGFITQYKVRLVHQL
jgi:hypothetical protein